MISSMDSTVLNSSALFLDSSDSRMLQQRRKPARSAHRKKKSRHQKVVREKALFGLDEEEMVLELDDREFMDDDLVSLDEFDSILHETEGKTFNGREADDCLEEEPVCIDRRKPEDRRKDSAHSPSEEKLERRKKVQRRRQIDPTTCERDYTTEQVEFMTALDEYKRNSGRMFPTCSEILEVLLGLGYAKIPLASPVDEPHVPAMQEQAMINVFETPDATELAETSSVLLTPKIVNSCQEDQRPSGAGYFGGMEVPVANPGSGPETIEILPVTFLTEHITTEESMTVVLPGLEYSEEEQPFLVNESAPVVGVPILAEVFPPKELGQTLFV